MAEQKGYRGYIASRPVADNRTPQHVQNLVIREYARRRGLEFLLSATELSVANSYVVLNDVIAGIDKLEGVIFYSLHMLPTDAGKRQEILKSIIGAGATFHAAVEEHVCASEQDIAELEEIWRINAVLPQCLTAHEMRQLVG